LESKKDNFDVSPFLCHVQLDIKKKKKKGLFFDRSSCGYTGNKATERLLVGNGIGLDALL
jgi:hypothetical protein